MASAMMRLVQVQNYLTHMEYFDFEFNPLLQVIYSLVIVIVGSITMLQFISLVFSPLFIHALCHKRQATESNFVSCKTSLTRKQK